MTTSHAASTAPAISLQEQLRRKLAQTVDANEPPAVNRPAVAAPAACELRNAFLAFLFELMDDGERDQSRSLEKLLGPAHCETFRKMAAGFKANVLLQARFGVQELVDAVFARILHRGRELSASRVAFMQYGLDAQTRYLELVSSEVWAIRKEGLSVRELWVLDKAERAACDFYRIEQLHPFAARNINNSFNLALNACRGAQTPAEMTAGLNTVWNAFEMQFLQIEDAKACSVRLHAAMHVLNLVREQAQATRKLAKEGRRSRATDEVDLTYLDELEEQGRAQASSWVAEGIVPDSALDTGDAWPDPGPWLNINGQPMSNGFDTFGNVFGVTFNDPF